MSDFGSVIKQFESRDRYEIQATLDRWLAVLSSYANLEKTKQALEQV